MEKTKLSKANVHLHKVELNDKGEYIAISSDDDSIFDRFVAGYKHIVQMADELPQKIERICKKYEGKEDILSVMEKTSQLSRANVEFSEETFKTIDGIFGEGTLKKYFREIFEEIPDFLPGSSCIIEFFEKITPVMENLFDRKVEDMQKASKEKMSKYKPQDHKKPQRKSASN